MSGYFDKKEKECGVFSNIIEKNDSKKESHQEENKSKSPAKIGSGFEYGPVHKLELKNISQIYFENGKKNVIFDNFNLQIRDIADRGQFTVIVGASGCGKSTLLRYFTGLQQPTSGEVFVNGNLLTRKDKIGMVFQQYSSFPWLTVLKNVALPLELMGVSKKEREERAMEMIKIVNLEEHAHKYAQYPILSGGQLQRVAIARSLIANGEILLLDEPFGALDVNTRLRMQDMLVEIWEKVPGDPTFVLVTHDLSEAVYLADEIIILKANPGEIHEIMTINEIPVKRDASVKRTHNFIEYVNYLEDTMMKINKK